ncbi:Glycosyltransferase involved in cell wall bisynthesis [Marinospirillum celere]|uniref:Glycosyltransferase involved in cell wall bisynthesis n=1 Tax=Marinospirillum celere TaxID=1122252 RepID=A0A1I1GWJ8_9GAMM|nr:CDP-glycerol glycerophosphotransferase family protein [Marinospirillum celere]SFC14208.1 Glycosyltransferase involved in cell wall bisynthesis [Marinospirillum celere]
MDTSQSFWKNCGDSKIGPKSLYELQRRLLTHFILPCIPSGGSTIDLACSDGEFTSLLSIISSVTKGYDISPKLVKKANESFGDSNITFEVSDLVNEELHGKYNTVSCMGLFTCITNNTHFKEIVEKIDRISGESCYLILKDTLTEQDKSIHINNGNYEAIYRNEIDYIDTFKKYGFTITQRHSLHKNEKIGIESVIFLLHRSKKTAVTDSTKKNIAIIHQFNESWVNVDQLYKELSNKEGVNCFAIITPFLHKNYEWSFFKSKEHLDSFGVKNFRWDQIDLSKEYFDATVFLSPYEKTRPLDIATRKIKEISKLTIYIPYGLECGGGEGNINLQYKQPSLEFIDVVYTRSELAQQQFIKYCPYPAEVIPIGHPRLDYISSGLHTKTTHKKFTILWTPHFSFTSNKWSSFDIFFEFLVDLQSNNRDLKIIFRPHPMFYKELNQIGFDKEKTKNILSEMHDLGFMVDKMIDHRPSFMESDIILADPGSFLIEYLATGKPVVYLENPFGFGLNDEVKDLIDSFYVASSPIELSKIIFDLKDKNDTKFTKRQHATNKTFKNIGTASKMIADDIIRRTFENRRYE